MKDWKQLAAALALDIPAADLEKLAPVMDALETSFRPLVRELPFATEPAVVYNALPEVAE